MSQYYVQGGLSNITMLQITLMCRKLFLSGVQMKSKHRPPPHPPMVQDVRQKKKNPTRKRVDVVCVEFVSVSPTFSWKPMGEVCDSVGRLLQLWPIVLHQNPRQPLHTHLCVSVKVLLFSKGSCMPLLNRNENQDPYKGPPAATRKKMIKNADACKGPMYKCSLNPSFLFFCDRLKERMV